MTLVERLREADDMALPGGKTCGDCEHISLCQRLFGCLATNSRCDWSPSRFSLRIQAQEARNA